MAITDLLKTFKTKQGNSVLDDLERYIMRKGPGLDLGYSYEERAKGVFHPSTLSSVACLRALVYSMLNTPASNPQHNINGEFIFGAGHDFGRRLQGYFWDMGVLLGKWRCVSCNYEWLDMEKPSPRICPSCGIALEIWYNLHYLEVPLYNKEYNIVGKADAAILRGNKKVLGEFKTIKNRDLNTRKETICFDDLVSPKREHLLQLNLYLHMAEDLYKGFDEGFFIYGAKNTNRSKIFEIRYIPELAYQMFNKAAMVTEHIKQEVLPNVLGDRNCLECRFCKWKDFCATNKHFAEADNRKKE